MPSLEAFTQMTGSYGPLIAVTMAVFLGLDTLFRFIARSRRDAEAVNSRLRLQNAKRDNREALVELRRRRGLTVDGGYVLSFIALNRLLIQSGLQVGIPIIIGGAVAVGLLAAALARFMLVPLPMVVLLGLVAAVGFPMLALFIARARRRKKLEEQLPSAVDVMVRSLRAGHPIPVAVSLVAREMPDPVGTEFGMVADEMTYGLDLATAVGNLRERTGQLDFALLAVAISIQSRTGGNLAELLSNLGRMIRERSKMRRKIRALSAEGRMSALLLTLVPILLYLMISVLSPSYYEEVKHDPWFENAIYAGLGLWLTGIFMIRRLVNFKI